MYIAGFSNGAFLASTIACVDAGRIAAIPTRLVLHSECDRQLLAAAAAKLVAEHRGEILDFMNRP